jgi:hypothetical protein
MQRTGIIDRIRMRRTLWPSTFLRRTVAVGALVAVPAVFTTGAPVARIEALTAASAISSIDGAAGSAKLRAGAAVVDLS